MPKRGQWELGVTASENDPFPLQGHTDKRQRTHSRKAHQETRTALLLRGALPSRPWKAILPHRAPLTNTCKWRRCAQSGDELHNFIPTVLSRIYSSGHKYSRGSPFLVLREQVSHPSCLLPSQAFIQDSFWVDLRLFHSERERLPHCKKSSL